MDELNKLIDKIDKESPGFKEKVKKRSKEVQIAHQLRLARESLISPRKTWLKNLYPYDVTAQKE